MHLYMIRKCESTILKPKNPNARNNVVGGTMEVMDYKEHAFIIPKQGNEFVSTLE